MGQTIKRILFFFVMPVMFCAGIVLSISLPQPSYATNLHDLTTGAGTETHSVFELSGGGIYETGGRLIPFIGNLIGVTLGVLGVVMVILIILGGFEWMTAAGDDKKVKLAIDHLRNAIIGAIIIVSAWTITTFVLKAIGGAATQ